MQDPVARLDGYTETIAAIRALPRAQQKALTAGFRAAGQKIADGATRRLLALDSKLADRIQFRPYVRLRGVEVDEVYRRTTGLRPDFGGTQMKHGLLPEAEADVPDILALVEAALHEAQAAVGL